MNSNIVNKVLATVLTGAFLFSMGANAAEKTCPKGEHYDTIKGRCVVDKK